MNPRLRMCRCDGKKCSLSIMVVNGKFNKCPKRDNPCTNKNCSDNSLEECYSFNPAQWRVVEE